jgi:hypothetical protein
MRRWDLLLLLLVAWKLELLRYHMKLNTFLKDLMKSMQFERPGADIVNERPCKTMTYLE